MTPGEQDRILYETKTAPVRKSLETIIQNANTRLPSSAAEREHYPICTGFFDYFPDAVAEVAKLSYDATKQHHPDAEMHWDRGKSTGHADKILRHMAERDTVDVDGHLHMTKVAWRAMAQLQEHLERTRNLPPSRASRGKRTWE